MMRISDYPAQIADAGMGKVLIPDYEVDLVCSYDDEHGVSIDGIYRDGVDLDRSSDPLFKSLAATIRTQAEADPWVIGHFEPSTAAAPAASRSDALHQARMEGVAL